MATKQVCVSSLIFIVEQRKLAKSCQIMKPESITGDKREYIDMEMNQCIYLDPKKKP
jgi:hypothetical protein